MTRTPAISDPDQASTPVFAGVDTHKELHVAARHRRPRDSVGHQELPDYTHRIPGDARLDRRVW